MYSLFAFRAKKNTLTKSLYSFFQKTAKPNTLWDQICIRFFDIWKLRIHFKLFLYSIFRFHAKTNTIQTIIVFSICDFLKSAWKIFSRKPRFSIICVSCRGVSFIVNRYFVGLIPVQIDSSFFSEMPVYRGIFYF